MNIIWAIAIVIFVAAEAATVGLVSIWFALGSLAALLSALMKAPLWLQIVWFFVVSIALLLLTRPLAQRFVNTKVQPTNADMVIGREALVTEAIDNVRGSGAVNAEGKIWTARSEDDAVTFAAGERVSVLRIEGVKLIVRKKT